MHSLKNAVIAAVLVNRKQAAPFLRESNQVAGFFQRWRQRFIDHYIAACRETLSRYGIVGVVRRSDYNQSNIRNCEQLFDAADNARIRIQFFSLVAASLHNRRKPQATNSVNDRRVKAPPCQAESDKSDVNHWEPCSVQISTKSVHEFSRAKLPSS